MAASLKKFAFCLFSFSFFCFLFFLPSCELLKFNFDLSIVFWAFLFIYFLQWSLWVWGISAHPLPHLRKLGNAYQFEAEKPYLSFLSPTTLASSISCINIEHHSTHCCNFASTVKHNLENERRKYSCVYPCFLLPVFFPPSCVLSSILTSKDSFPCHLPSG